MANHHSGAQYTTVSNNNPDVIESQEQRLFNTTAPSHNTVTHDVSGGDYVASQNYPMNYAPSSTYHQNSFPGGQQPLFTNTPTGLHYASQHPQQQSHTSYQSPRDNATYYNTNNNYNIPRSIKSTTQQQQQQQQHQQQHQQQPHNKTFSESVITHNFDGQQHRNGGSPLEGCTINYSASRPINGNNSAPGERVPNDDRIIREEIREKEVRIPKRVVREEIIEKVIVVPETITREEIVDDIHLIKETVIEIAKPVIHEKIVEVPEIEYRDKIIEVTQKIVQDRIKEVPVYQVQERIIEVPKYITQEKIVEVPEIEYRDIVTERIVEVPEIREQIVVKEVPVPQYVEKQVPNYVTNEVEYLVERQVPVPVEAITTFEYQLAQFRTRVNKVEYPLYVPKFIEVAVAAECFDENRVAEMQAQGAKLAALTAPQAIGLADVENLATEFQRQNIMSQPLTMQRLPNVMPAANTTYKTSPVA